MTHPTYPINAASEVLERNRRAVGRAVRHVKPDEIKAGQPRWLMSTIFKAFEATYHQPQQPSDKSFSNAKTRKALADAENAEFNTAERRGEWSRTDVSVATFLAEALAIRENLLSMPGKTADSLHQVDRDVAFMINKTEAHDCLNRMADGRSCLSFAIECVKRAGGKPDTLTFLEKFATIVAEIDEKSIEEP